MAMAARHDADTPRARIQAAAGQPALDEAAAKAVLAALGIAVPRGLRLAPGQAPALAGLRGPFALKALSDAALHKSDIGAVRLNLRDAAAVAAAQAEIAARMAAAGAGLTGFLLEEMAAPGTEIVIGGTTDPQLGPMLMLGAGGIFAEILHDVTFRLCPITPQDADEMLAELKIAAVLRGARGRPGADLAAIRAALLALGGAEGFFTRNADLVAEFDLNPLIARPDGLVAVDCRIVLGAASPARPPARPADFAKLLAPASIAVVGASASGTSAGNRYLRILKAEGFAGDIWPIHPQAAEIEGLPAFPSLAELPGVADYVYLTIPAGRVEGALAGAGGKLRFAQVMASDEPATQHDWEARLADLARTGGFRLIGPNCMGTHAPRARATFMEGAALTAGDVGIGCQSGGLGMDILRRGQNLGLAFSGLVTLGNSVDVGPSDLLEHFLHDEATRVIGFYLEDVKDGARFQRLLRQNAGRKPVVLLVGGITGLGRQAAASHTGALGGSAQAWGALAAQTGAILTETLDAFLDALQLCQWLTPGAAERADVTLFGNGGGTSVLATDALDRAGFRLAEPGPEARAAFAQIDLPPGASLANPIDLPASVLKEEAGRVAARILGINRRLVAPWATIVHLNLPVIMGYRHVENFLPNLMSSVFGGEPGGPHRILVLRSDRSAEVDAWRRTFREGAAARGVPSFDEVPQAVDALAAFRQYESFLARRGARQ